MTTHISSQAVVAATKYLLRMFGLQTQKDVVPDRAAMPNYGVVHMGQRNYCGVSRWRHVAVGTSLQELHNICSLHC